MAGNWAYDWNDPYAVLKGTPYEDSAQYFGGGMTAPSAEAQAYYQNRVQELARQKQQSQYAGPRQSFGGGQFGGRPSTPRAPTGFSSGPKPRQAPSPNTSGPLQSSTWNNPAAAGGGSSSPGYAPSTPGANWRGGAGDLNAALGLNALRGDGPQIGSPKAVTAAKRTGSNPWENMALGSFAEGFDPGQQFTGKELADTVWSPEQINQIAQQRAAPTLRAFRDAQRNFAAQAARGGGGVDPARMASLKARAAIEGAGAINAATRDAQLEGAKLNAEQAARSAENQRQNYTTDVEGRLGLGRLGLDTASTAGGFGMTRRGQDQARDLAIYEGGIAQRGQDLTRSMRQAELDAGRQSDAARLGLEMRGQDISADNSDRSFGLQGRGQNIERELGLGRLGMEKYQTDAQSQNATADRQNRLTMLDRELADRSLDRESRAALERERMQVTRELSDLERNQRESEFSRSYSQSGSQFDRRLAEESRQFDQNKDFTADQNRYARSANEQNLMQTLYGRNFEQILGGLQGGQYGYDDFQRMLEELNRSLRYAG